MRPARNPWKDILSRDPSQRILKFYSKLGENIILWSKQTSS